MAIAENLVGRRFGRYFVIDRAPTIAGNVRWVCRCDCGRLRSVQAGILRAGTARSCGCAQKEQRRGHFVDKDVIRIQLTKGLIAVVDIVDLEIATLNWSANQANADWYAARRENGVRFYLHRVVAMRAGHCIDGIEVDHKDGDRLNCRRENLRPATHAQNAKNAKRSNNNTSGYKGVGWHASSKSWHARIGVNGKTVSLGYWHTREAAAVAYANASRRFHGEFGRLG